MGNGKDVACDTLGLGKDRKKGRKEGREGGREEEGRRRKEGRRKEGKGSISSLGEAGQRKEDIAVPFLQFLYILTLFQNY